MEDPVAAPANPPPAELNILARIFEASEQRRLRRDEHDRAVTAATRVVKREVQNAERAMIAAQERYTNEVYYALGRSRVYVRNMNEVNALMEMLKGAQQPYTLSLVTIRSEDPNVAEQMRWSLEVGGGFQLLEGAGHNDTYTIPLNE